MNYVTIGRLREDGDLDVFATLNNDWLELPAAEFEKLVESCRAAIPDDEGVIYYRQDAPDVITIDEDETV